MSDTETQSVTELEELLDAEIPCSSGNCDRSAQLRTDRHYCPNLQGPSFCCIQCWQKWLNNVMAILTQQGFLQCNKCDQRFSSVEAFSDFRPF